MTEVRGGVFSPEDARKIHAKVLGISNQQPPLVGSQMQQVQNLLYYVLLTEDLAAAADAETGYSQAEGRVLRYVQPVDASTLDMEQSTTSQGLITVTNRFTSFSAVSGDLLLVIRNQAEYSPVNVVSSSQKHAQVVRCLGDGYYTVQIANTTSFDLPGTGTFGIIEVAGTGTAGCNLCDQIVGETGTAASGLTVTCGSLSQPSRTSVTGDGDRVFAYDPRKLLLPNGAHVVISNMGDTVQVPNAGTGTVPGTEPLWIILTGNYTLIAIPDRFYECCDNVPVLIKCDQYITEGIYCPGQEITCAGTAI